MLSFLVVIPLNHSHVSDHIKIFRCIYICSWQMPWYWYIDFFFSFEAGFQLGKSFSLSFFSSLENLDLIHIYNIHPLKVYNIEVFSIFIELCDYQHCLISHFHTHKETLCLLTVTPHCIPQCLGTINLLSSFVDFPILHISFKWNIMIYNLLFLMSFT